ncbi:MAG TPA: TIGR04283 family arsenosugar biosynthesis glycosyltransferase [Stellaceae bacterium]|nr:TIGR04283 family arsenosugar biosynthesis glycosyltransferase [Stellaceae bacterium]
MPRVSAVIPTLDEADRLPALVEALRREPELAEIIVADGGSSDGTAELAARLGARVVTSARGRGPALRAGAALANGEVLLFLHADSRFPSGGLLALCAALDRDARVPGGNFRVVFDGNSRFARGLTLAYPWLRLATLYYGDSGIFVRRAVYEAIGGIKPIPLMEDYDFVRRLERAGPTCRIEDPPLITSSRKFEGRRASAIVWGWVVVHVLYWLGVSPERLARLYYPRGWRGAGRTDHRRCDDHGD